jgi:hypothetical protein
MRAAFFLAFAMLASATPAPAHDVKVGRANST